MRRPYERRFLATTLHYQSSAHFLGLPLVHIARGPRFRFGGPKSRVVAKGWIAIGDVAVGLIAIGGLATGGFAIGGAAVGVLSIGGLAIGAASIGGISAGLLAVGGVALGLVAAVGGVAVARDFAIGGVGFARDVNNSSATHYVDTQLFFRIASWVNFHAITLAFLPMMVVFLLVIAKILRGSTHRDIT
jgi:hypothetical protein